MNCLIIDDDPLVCETVESYLQRVGGAETCLKVGDVTSALSLLAAGDFDVVFLDLRMPDGDGESILRAIPRQTAVVVITAHTDFAAQSYAFDVADYLVKPIDFPRFCQAMQKVRQRIGQRTENVASTAAPQPAVSAGPADREIFVKDGTRLVRVSLPRVLFFEAEANYVRIVGDDPPLMPLISLKRLETLLPTDFLRIHRSYIVNRRRIGRIEDGVVHIGDHHLPIGESYRDGLYKKLGVLA